MMKVNVLCVEATKMHKIFYHKGAKNMEKQANANSGLMRMNL